MPTTKEPKNVTFEMQINQTLFRDAESCAKECGMETARFLAEVIESYVAGRRFNRSVPKVASVA